MDEPAASQDLGDAVRRPLRGQIRRVTGRRAIEGQRGQPAIDEIAFELPDGSTATFGPPDRGEAGTLTFLSQIPSGTFTRPGTDEAMCPICLAVPANSKEHVPQGGLGGSHVTFTCEACNNGLGSKVEAALQDWFDHAITARFEHDGEVPGRRRVPKIYFRRNADTGAFALVVDGDVTPEVEKILGSPEFRMQFQEAQQRACGIALLKAAYLTACLFLGAVPDHPEARAIRADLIAARDAPKGRAPASEAAARLKVYRSHVGRQGPPLALVGQRAEDGTEPTFLLSLAGVLFVSWPFVDLPPGAWQRLEDGIQEET